LILFLITTLAYHALIAIVWTRWFRINYLTSLGISIPILLGANVILSRSLYAIGVEEPLAVCYVLWLLLAVVLLLKSKNSFVDFQPTAFFLAFGVGLLSTIVWASGIGGSAKPPQDNDAIVHAFGIRYLVQNTSLLNCQVPRDGLFNFGNRFMPCGSYEIAANYLRWNSGSAIDVLNGLYLVGAFFLPFGLVSVRRTREVKSWILLITGLSSISFLVAPYAINGLMPLSFGFAFVIPLANFLISNSFKKGRDVLLAGTSILGLAIIHPLPALLVLVLFALSKTLTIRSFVSKKLYRPVALLILTAVVPLFLIFENSQYLFQGLTTSNNASDRGLTIGVMQQLFLGSHWTRPQPVIAVLIVLGIVHSWKSSDLFERVCAMGSCVLFALWITNSVDNAFLDVIQVPFYGQWYRILAAFVIVAAIPLGVGVSVLLQNSTVQSKKIVRNTVVLLLVTGFSVSLATGGRIVEQAWSRDTTPPSKLFSEMKKLASFDRLRVLNDPIDGSMWTYGVSGVYVAAAVDRGVDLRYGDVVSALESKQDIDFACSVITTMNLDGILLIDASKIKSNKLLLNNIVDKPIFNDGPIFLALFSNDFKRTCSKDLVYCKKTTSVPIWYSQIRDERMPRTRCM
jgi:hypothetical protein